MVIFYQYNLQLLIFLVVAVTHIQYDQYGFQIRQIESYFYEKVANELGLSKKVTHPVYYVLNCSKMT